MTPTGSAAGWSLPTHANSFYRIRYRLPTRPTGIHEAYEKPYLVDPHPSGQHKGAAVSETRAVSGGDVKPLSDVAAVLGRYERVIEDGPTPARSRQAMPRTAANFRGDWKSAIDCLRELGRGLKRHFRPMVAEFHS